jgi:hypothetical protein
VIRWHKACTHGWNGVPHHLHPVNAMTCISLAHTVTLHLTTPSKMYYNAGAAHHRPALSHSLRYHCHQTHQKSTSILHWCYPQVHTSCATAGPHTSNLHLTVDFLLCTGATHQIPRPAAGQVRPFISKKHLHIGFLLCTGAMPSIAA